VAFGDATSTGGYASSVALNNAGNVVIFGEESYNGSYGNSMGRAAVYGYFDCTCPIIVGQSYCKYDYWKQCEGCDRLSSVEDCRHIGLNAMVYST
jgi:hypothetical protein